MNEFARRFLPAHAAAVNAVRDDEYADVFIHSKDLVDEISGAVSEARDQVDQLMTERRHRDLAAMIATTAAIERLLSQSQNMVRSLDNVLGFHRSLRSRCGND